MPHVIIEYDFDPPVTDDALRKMGATVASCIQARQIRRLRTVVSQDRRHGFCELLAPDADSVREAYHSARVPFRSVWSAELFEARPEAPSRDLPASGDTPSPR